MLLEFEDNTPIVLIDASYYVFYRYFATMRWFVFQKQEFDADTITENEVYISSFIKHMESDMKKICKKWKTTINNIVFCLDCQRCDIWRNDIYSEYKGTRVQNANFNNKIFSVFTEYIENKDIKRVNFDRLEADDVVYLMQDKLKEIGNNSIIVITNDNDYLQIASNRTSIINMQFKDITLRGQKNAKADLYHKAIYGDKSDNILKIASFITKEKALEISQLSDYDIEQWLNDNDIIDKFNMNMTLISFDNIPKKIVKQFYDKVKLKIK